MVATSKFQGRFYYYENINGKEKRVEKEFTDPKKYGDFVKQYPMPSLSSFWGLGAPSALAGKPAKKALPVKRAIKAKKTPSALVGKPTKKKIIKKKK
ncbi:MAG: hypothetical protein CO170_00715 [candidate division SR1 bacterium CG_4_9_14_3_um_filter_40_9]|nr:MAG: hypothetical protein CO170_00715 [candidate division SR1 bacterium CG_4_9_14_3_um_filter_40_9]